MICEHMESNTSFHLDSPWGTCLREVVGMYAISSALEQHKYQGLTLCFFQINQRAATRRRRTA